MPRIAARRIEGAGWSLEPKRYEKAIRDAIEKEAKPVVFKMMKEVVQGKRYSNNGDAWKHDVQFQARFQMHGSDAVLYAYPTGRNKQIWNWVSRGTRPHKIRPKNAPALAFMYGGPGVPPPKTRTPRGAGGTFGGAGVAKMVFAQEVDHPGGKPRHFEEQIAEEYAPQFKHLIRVTLDKLLMEKNQPYVGNFGSRIVRA